MDLVIHSNGFTISAQLDDFIEKKMSKLETFHDKIISTDVYLKLENHQQIKEKITEVKIRIPGSTLFATEKAKTFEESTDMAVESIVRQIKRIKEKQRIA